VKEAQSNDDSIANQLNEFKSFGFRYPSIDTFDGGDVQGLGTNFQMNKIQFAAGVRQLARFNHFLEYRRLQFETLFHALCDVENLHVHFNSMIGHACLLFIVSANAASSSVIGKRLRANLEHMGVGTRHHYPPVWDWPVYKQMSYSGAKCPSTMAVAPNLISLPVHPDASLEDIRRLSVLVTKALRV
jgi:perosamine synthetase